VARQLSNWLDEYLRYSQFSESPENFHFWTGVSVVAGALRRHVWIDMGYFQWTPCFYIVFVAPPGIVSKSTTANVGMNLLREVPGVTFGPDAVTWQSLIQSLAASAETFEYDQLLHTMSSISIVSSEFGTFLNPNDREMVDVLVSLWDGQIGTWEKATKTQGNDKIQNPWINLIACTTPAWIQGNFPEYMIGGGFTSRTIFVYGEEKRKLVAYPAKELPKDFEAQRLRLIHDLEHIALELIGPYSLSDSATKWGTEWYERLYATNLKTLAQDRFAGYVARKQTHLHKLAMILAASYKDERVIEAADLQLAEARLLEAEQHQELVFSKIVSPEARPSNLIMDVMRRQHRMNKRALFMSVFQSISHKQFEEALAAGIAAGLLQEKVFGHEQVILFTGKAPENENTILKGNTA
jgi:hypothetical protein